MNVGVLREHLLRNVASNCHHGLVAGLGLRKFADCVIAQIVKAKSSSRAFHFMYVGFRFPEIGRQQVSNGL
jgi:hypothetical protein